MGRSGIGIPVAGRWSGVLLWSFGFAALSSSAQPSKRAQDQIQVSLMGTEAPVPSPRPHKPPGSSSPGWSSRRGEPGKVGEAFPRLFLRQITRSPARAKIGGGAPPSFSAATPGHSAAEIVGGRSPPIFSCRDRTGGGVPESRGNGSPDFFRSWSTGSGVRNSRGSASPDFLRVTGEETSDCEARPTTPPPAPAPAEPPPAPRTSRRARPARRACPARPPGRRPWPGSDRHGGWSTGGGRPRCGWSGGR